MGKKHKKKHKKKNSINWQEVALSTAIEFLTGLLITIIGLLIEKLMD